MSIGLVSMSNAYGQDYNSSKPNIKGPYGVEVNSFTGNLYCSRQDIEIPGRGLDLSIAFAYNSLHRQRTFGFGYGWSFAFSMGIEPDSNGVWLRRMDGKRDLFREQGGVLVGPPGVFDVLEQPSTGQYMLTAKNGTRYFFEDPAHKRLTRINDRYGNTIELTYTDSLLTGLEDATGRSVALEYTDGLLTSVASQTSPARTVSYTYDAEGNLVKVTDALGQDIIYVYDDAHNLIGMADRNTNPLRIIYNDNGACIRLASCLGEMKIHYDQDARKTHVTEEVEGEHQLTTYTYDTANRLIKQEGNCCGYNTRFEYDDVGNITKRINGNGNATRYSYDAQGNVTQEIDPMGRTYLYTYEPAFNQVANITDRRGNTTSFTYSGTGDLLTVTMPMGITSSFTYNAHGQRLTSTDPRGMVHQYGYDAHGYLNSISDPEGGVTLLTYDEVGDLVSQTSPNGHTTTFAYDALGRMTAVTDPLGHQTTLVYDGKENVIQVTDALGRVTRYDYDPLDRLMNEEDALGQVTQYHFDAKGNLRRHVDPLGHATQLKYDKQNRLKEAINAIGESTRYEYDGVGNLTLIRRPDGNTLSFDYDPLSRLTAVQDLLGAVKGYAYDENSNIVSESDGLGNTIAFAYDELNRLSGQTDPMGNATEFTYDASGNILSFTDRLGNVTSFTYDDLGRRLTETDALNGVKQFAYDGNGNVISITDQNGNTTSYTYDANNDLVTEIYPDASTRSYTYDAVRKPITRTDNNGVTTTYVHDAVDRLLSRSYAGGGTDEFVYDLKGRMTEANNATVDVSFNYDPLDRLTSEVMGTETIGFGYDTPGRQRTVVYPGGRVVQETMDPRGRLTRITDLTSSPYVLAEQTFDLGDRKMARSYSNGNSSVWAYDANARVTSIVHGPNAHTGFTYGYDDEDNRLYEQRAHQPSQSAAYSYDPLLRLTAVATGTLNNGAVNVPTGSESFNYDLLGNRITATQNGTSTSYVTNNLNQYTSYSTTTTTALGHDSNGNLISEGVRTFQYDVENRIIAVDGGSTSSYGYDALGRRVRKTVAGTTTWFYHDGINVIEEQDNAHATTATYVFGHVVDEILHMQRGAINLFYAHDALGSVVALTDQTGQVVERYAYSAYGEVTIRDGANNVMMTSAFGNSYMFASRAFDSQLNGYYNRLRQYSSKLGRFTQRDPLGFIDGPSLYQYGHSSPGNQTDPLGLAASDNCDPECDPLGASMKDAFSTNKDIGRVAKFITGLDTRYGSNDRIYERGPKNGIFYGNQNVATIGIPGVAGIARYTRVIAKTSSTLGRIEQGAKVAQALCEDGGKIGPRTLRAVGNWAGGEIGSYHGGRIGGRIGGQVGLRGGALLGATVGTVLIPIPVVGSAIGGALGGIVGFGVGTFIGSSAGSSVGGSVGGYTGGALYGYIGQEMFR